MTEVFGAIGWVDRGAGAGLGALMNNPLRERRRQIWQVYTQVTPPVGTAVDVTIELEKIDKLMIM